jgi:hypothetical protein
VTQATRTATPDPNILAEHRKLRDPVRSTSSRITGLVPDAAIAWAGRATEQALAAHLTRVSRNRAAAPDLSEALMADWSALECRPLWYQRYLPRANAGPSMNVRIMDLAQLLSAGEIRFAPPTWIELKIQHWPEDASWATDACVSLIDAPAFAENWRQGSRRVFVTRAADGDTMGIAGPVPPEYLTDVLNGVRARRTKTPALRRIGRPFRILPYGMPRRIVGMAWLELGPCAS